MNPEGTNTQRERERERESQQNACVMRNIGNNADGINNDSLLSRMYVQYGFNVHLVRYKCIFHTLKSYHIILSPPPHYYYRRRHYHHHCHHYRHQHQIYLYNRIHSHRLQIEYETKRKSVRKTGG